MTFDIVVSTTLNILTLLHHMQAEWSHHRLENSAAGICLNSPGFPKFPPKSCSVSSSRRWFALDVASKMWCRIETADTEDVKSPSTEVVRPSSKRELCMGSKPEVLPIHHGLSSPDSELTKHGNQQKPPKHQKQPATPWLTKNIDFPIFPRNSQKNPESQESPVICRSQNVWQIRFLAVPVERNLHSLLNAAQDFRWTDGKSAQVW